MKRIRKLLLNKENKRLLENFFSLSILNFINYLFPLILIPYLTRILGVEKFGLYAFSYAVIQYCTVLVSYGFDYSATKYVAINRDNLEKISEVFICVIIVRLALALVCVVLVLAATGLINKLRGEYLLYVFGIGIFLGQALIPLWLFQGMEQMKFVTIINFISKLTSTLLIFIFLKNQSDYIYVNLFFSIGFLVAGILSILLAIRIFRIKFILPKSEFIKDRIRDGWHLFLSTVFMNLYRESNILILGSFVNYTVVGYYAAAEKIIKAIQSIVSPISTALFPYFGRNLNLADKKERTLKLFFRFNKYYAIALALIVCIVLFSSKYIVTYYLGNGYTNSIQNIKIMSVIILLGGLNYFLGIVGLVNLGFEKQFTQSVFVAGVISIITCFTLVNILPGTGAAITLVIAEVVLFILILNVYRIRMKKIQIL